MPAHHSLCVSVSLRISTISPVVGGQASVSSGLVDWAGLVDAFHRRPTRSCFLLSTRGVGGEEEGRKKTVRERLFVPLQEQSGLEGSQGSQTHSVRKRGPLTWGTGLLTSAHWEERTARDIRGEQLNRWTTMR